MIQDFSKEYVPIASLHLWFHTFMFMFHMK